MGREVRRTGAAKRLLVLLGWVALTLGLAGGPARAFSFFGLFGDDVPEPSATALPYEVTFQTKGDDGVDGSLEQASNLYKLRRDAPPDGDTLVARVRADFAPLIDALWASGYYNARLVVEVAGVPLEIGRDREGAAARAANALKGQARVPVKVMAETGPLFRFRRIELVDATTGVAFFPPDRLPRSIVKIQPGDPARSVDIQASVARLSDWFRRQSYPLVKVTPPAPVVDHAAEVMDITFVVATGPKAGIGAVTIRGPERFPQAVVRSFVYLEEGQPYSPKALEDTRRSIATIPAAGSVRVREGDRLDRNGNLPIFIDVTDRAPNLIGFSAGFSTVDGPTVRTYYENRNLFGGAERLRLEAAVFQAPRIDGSTIRSFDDIRLDDLGGRVTASFLKPALWGSRTDFLFDVIAERNRYGGGRFGGYEDRFAGATPALRFRFDQTWSAMAGLKYERGWTQDVLGKVDYQLVGVPLTVRFDNTDKLLDPSTGFRVNANVTPYASLGSSASFTRANADASAYYAFDEDARFILAGRVAGGGFLEGPTRIEEIPANYRFYAGGAGSIRGYRYQTVAPRGPFGFVVGGRSLVEANIEARVRVTDTIGLVPFFDAGGAYTSQVPNFKGDTRMSAGLGLRYYTGIGPIRLDVAVPVNPRRGDKEVVLYVGIGQAF